MYSLLPVRAWIFIIWAVLISAGVYFRPLLPVDETRYAAVAWEMWSRNDFLVPHLNGETYSHKPPLLFWLMTLSWWLFGVNDWSLRIISPLFSLATLFLSCRVARALWPNRGQLEELTPMILLGSSLWIVYSTLTMFDMMLAFFVLLGIYSLIKLAYTGLPFRYWLLLGIAIGGGVLSKGPVILLHLLPVALTAPWWSAEKKTDFRWLPWLGGLSLSVLIGAVIALCWAIPAGISGGEAYRNAIFLGQTGGRLVKSFAHRLPWWWYLQMLPIFLLPWLFVKPFWNGAKKLSFRDPGIRFCLAWVLPVLLAFSLVSGKRIHYLLPLFPALALMLARAADEEGAHRSWARAHLAVVGLLALLGLILASLPWLNGVYHWRPDLSLVSPVWGGGLCIIAIILGASKADQAGESVFYICIAAVMALIISSSGFFSINAYRYDTKEPAQKIAALMAEKREIAYFGSKYHGQYHFTGRLTQPVTVISDANAMQRWAKDHLNGYILVPYKPSEALPDTVFSYHYSFKGLYIGFLPAIVFLENPSIGAALKL